MGVESEVHIIMVASLLSESGYLFQLYCGSIGGTRTVHSLMLEIGIRSMVASNTEIVGRVSSQATFCYCESPQILL